MGRYWSLEECCWVEYSRPTSEVADTRTVEENSLVDEQLPEQATPAQREPAYLS